MDPYLIWKILHLFGAALLFGTGLGIAFFGFMADRNGDVRVVASTMENVVRADFLFTATAVIFQPITGYLLMLTRGYGFFDFWLLVSLGLYILTGLCWLPVVWIQIRMRDLAKEADKRGSELPSEYHRLMKIWFWLGWPAFTSVIGIFGLMVFRPY